MSKVTIRALREHLRAKPHELLVEEIINLSSRNEAVREYFAAQLGLGPQEDVLRKYKAVITREFSGRSNSLPRLSTARKAVLDYKKLAQSSAPVIDLMLHYVESGVNFTNRFGDINESFYSSLERMYEQALKLIVQDQLRDQFESRCKQIVTETHGIGWGFHDQLSALYVDVSCSASKGGGDVVVAPFPFSDLSATKKRPALVVQPSARPPAKLLRVKESPLCRHLYFQRP